MMTVLIAWIGVSLVATPLIARMLRPGD